ncbi:MAG: DUF2752 domain-containing protein [Ignavibacteria bacterium]|nr:DUF2752 domain-containing protein [Ignavibacteria bacterium]
MLSAIKAAWIFYSLVIIAVLFILYTVPAEFLTNNTPICPSITLHQTECPACGLTRGFTAIADGRFTDAGSYNKHSLTVFLIFVANTTIFVVFGVIKTQTKKKHFLKFKRNKSWLKQV